MTDDTEKQLDIPTVSKVAGVNSTKIARLSSALEALVDNYTPMQKRYAEYRSKGLKQADAALKAGSQATGRGALGRVGYNFEQLEGMKEYIAYLYEKRARSSIVDEIEIIEKLRNNYEEAIALGRIDWANKTAELMGLMIGAFAKAPSASKATETKEKTSKINIDAFKGEEEEHTVEDKFKQLASLMKSVTNTNNSNS